MTLPIRTARLSGSDGVLARQVSYPAGYGVSPKTLSQMGYPVFTAYHAEGVSVSYPVDYGVLPRCKRLVGYPVGYGVLPGVKGDRLSGWIRRTIRCKEFDRVPVGYGGLSEGLRLDRFIRLVTAYYHDTTDGRLSGWLRRTTGDLSVDRLGRFYGLLSRCKDSRLSDWLRRTTGN